MLGVSATVMVAPPLLSLIDLVDFRSSDERQTTAAAEKQRRVDVAAGPSLDEYDLRNITNSI